MKAFSANVFISYSHKDEVHREQLETHLTTLKRQGLISTWTDRQIVPGKDWENEIDSALDSADVVLLLISPDFIASDYCFGKELSLSLLRHETNQAIVVPIIVRPTDWETAPFAKLQALPKDAQPVTKWENTDEVWLDVARGLRKTIESLRQQRERKTASIGLVNVGDLLTQETERLGQQWERSIGSAHPGMEVPSGFHDLDTLTGGLRRSGLTIVAARPSMGKTDFLIGIALNAAISCNLRVGFFSLQTPASKLVRRLFCSWGRIDSYKLERCNLGDEDISRLTAAMQSIHQAPLRVDDSLSMCLSDLIAHSRSEAQGEGLDLVLIDSIQHLGQTSSSDGLVAPPTQVSRALSLLARELHIPVVATCNLSRQLERRDSKRPMLGDLGEWESLEQDAEVILFLYSASYYSRRHVYEDDDDISDRECKPRVNEVEVIVAKNKNGPIGIVKLPHIPAWGRFENYIEEL